MQNEWKNCSKTPSGEKCHQNAHTEVCKILQVNCKAVYSSMLSFSIYCQTLYWQVYFVHSSLQDEGLQFSTSNHI